MKTITAKHLFALSFHLTAITLSLHPADMTERNEMPLSVCAVVLLHS